MNGGILHRHILKLLARPFFFSLLLFTFFVELLDVVINLVRYLVNEVPLATIAKIQYFYLPTSFSYALPVSILFSISFTMSTLYAHNEMISVYATGTSLLKFVTPLITLSVLVSVGNFFFNEEIVIAAAEKKNDAKRQALSHDLDESNVNVAVLDKGGRVVYRAEFYDGTAQSLTKVSVIHSDTDNALIFRLDAANARWSGDVWIFENPQVFRYDSGEVLLDLPETFSSPMINAPPKSFERVTNNTDEMKMGEALSYIGDLKNAGLPHHKLLTEVYARIPFALTPLIVTLIACFAANSYGKNTLLMSLLISLISVIIYYSTDLMGTVLASRFVLPPLLGAWLGALVTMGMTIILYKITSR